LVGSYAFGGAENKDFSAENANDAQRRLRKKDNNEAVRQREAMFFLAAQRP
jgi:hypothetical protein